MRILEIIAALALTVIGVASTATGAHASDGWKPCKYEDSVHCVWDARHMGNGEGRSFIARRDGSIDFITHRRAHRMLAR